jgi:hypothetical protein
LAWPHLTQARQVLTQYEAVPGIVRVVATSDDGSTTYQAGVQDRFGHDWTPETGDHPAQLRYLSNVPWPVLVVTEQGLLHPFRPPPNPNIWPCRKRMWHPRANPFVRRGLWPR